ncbi:MAG: phosphotransferase [Thermoleophilia bacterium]|nr:phosphotransferase [Thermoleophilia bacterium]
MEVGIARAVTRATESRPATWRPAGGGHTGAPKWLVELEDGRRVFVKGEASTEERTVYGEVSGPFLARVHGVEGDVLVLEDLSGATWPPPYPGDVRPLFAALEEVGETTPPAELPPLRGPRFWELVRADPAPFLNLGLVGDEWLERSLDALAAAESGAVLAGEALVHGDVWAGNVCFAPRGAVLVDWADARRGNPAFDVALAAISARIAGATLPPLDLDLAPWVALLSGHWAVVAPQPLPASIRADSRLREAQRADLAHALRWAAELLDLPPPG